MTFSGFDPELLGQLNKHSASAPQIYLLQRIARSIEPDALLTQHAAALAGMAAELPRAQAALLSHGERSQPQKNLLAALCQNAAAAVDRSRIFHTSEKLLNDIAAVLATVPSKVTGIADDSKREVNALALAARLDILIQDLPALLVSMFEKAWSLLGATSADWKYLDHISDEVACLVASSDRDRITLDGQLTNTIARDGMNLQAITRTLLPPKYSHHVACVVRGASAFSHLTILEPTGQQSSSEDGMKWGSAAPRLREYLAKVEAVGEQCVVSVDVEAVDKASAGRLGRRRITELLDQYVAGHRLLDLSLGPETLIARAGPVSDTQEWTPPHRGVLRAYPLLDRWPEGLRECLRMAHIARNTDSPLTAAALAWVALEASGVKYQQRRQLARVLSLQALRQQIVEAHLELLQSIRASKKYARTQVQNTAALVAQHQKGLAHCPKHLPAYSRLESSLESAVDAQVIAGIERDRLNTLFDRPLLEIGAYAPFDQRDHLTDLNQWVDVLLPARNSDSANLTGARTALDKIIPHLFPLAARQVCDWRERLKSPDECALWLSVIQQRIEVMLDALYGARNLALHSGIFAATGDAVLGRGAVMLADLTLEFLGNWYRTGTPAQYALTPAEVIQELADRQIQIIRQLNAHSSAAYPLNVGLLTSPSSPDGWDRV